MQNRLLFTFSSLNSPWTPDELDVLNNAIADFYPVIKSLYGEPAFTITVNLRKDPSILFPGEYSPKAKEIVLRDATQLDVLCHEMIHAFRDRNMILINSYEEGMTRAVQVEVFNRLPDYTFWNENHRYIYDVYYEGLNRRIIGSQSGNFDYASPFLLLRYNLAGYAWAKVLLENPDFFAEFNRRLYARAMIEPAVLSDIPTLREMARSLQPVVEGKPFLNWYERQGIFDPAPEDGYFLYQNISNFNVYYFFRDKSGHEKMIPGAPIAWDIFDFENRPLLSGNGVTTDLGWVSIAPVFPDGYRGRIKIVASAETPDGVLTNTAFAPVGDNAGIFGILEDFNSGTVIITALDANLPPAVEDVSRGMFQVPSFADEKGRFIIVYDDGKGNTFSKRFNKDASDYFLPMAKSDAVADLVLTAAVAPEQGIVGRSLTYTLTATNKGPGTASEIYLADVLPPGVTFVSAGPSQGSCIFSYPVVTCALDSIGAGASASVGVTVTPAQAGVIETNAYITANASDPDFTNNGVVLSSTVVDVHPAIRSITALEERISMLFDRKILNRGQAQALTASLQAAKRHIERSRVIPAISQIEAFINQVNAFLRTRILPKAEGEALKNEAGGIVRLLSRRHQAP